MASTRVTKVYTNTGDRRTYTVSAWVKRSKLGATQDVISAYRSTDGLQTDVMRFPSDDSFQFYMHSTNSAGNCELKTNRKFRDPNAWYHFVVRVDTTQSTNTDRVRIYVNGVQETSFATENYMNQNGEGVWGIGASHTTHTIGAVGTANYFDGYVSHVHYADGQSLAPTVFGSTDSTTGEWKINTSPSFTLGTNGFTILKDGNTVTDQSTNSNDFSVASGTLTKSEDNPSNIFATFNPLDNARNYSGTIDLKNGNTTQQNASDASLVSNLGFSSGKWYAEFKIVNATNTRTVGIIDISENQGYIAHGSLAAANSYGYKTNGQSLWNGTTEVATNVGEGVAGDIIGVAIDLDSSTKTIKWTKNGSDLSGTTSINISQSDVTWAFFVRADGGQTMSANFGNGYFGTTAVSSAGTNASGNGIFEYDVPSGYTALSTKGLNL